MLAATHATGISIAAVLGSLVHSVLTAVAAGPASIVRIAIVAGPSESPWVAQAPSSIKFVATREKTYETIDYKED